MKNRQWTPTLRVRRSTWVILMTVIAGNAVVAYPTSAQIDTAELQQKVVRIERVRGGGLPPEVGTGFFITPSGHILTAAHVLLNADEPDDVLRTRTVLIRLKDRSRHVARILGLNRMIDLALLKIKTDKPTPYLSLGKSDTARIGDLLTIVGHPVEGAEWEISSGNVERITPVERIHVRATLGPGYSGGPAVDASGRVVGVASYRAEGAEQSYLVPIDDAQSFLAGILPRVPGAKTSPTGAAISTTTAGVQPKQLTKMPMFQNSFLRVTLKSFSKSADKKKINLALTFESIAKDDFLISIIRGEENKYLIDDMGELWVLYKEAVGVTTISRYAGARSLFTPGQSSTVLFAFKPTGGLEGNVFDFAANLNGQTKRSNGGWGSIKFSIGLSTLVFTR